MSASVGPARFGWTRGDRSACEPKITERIMNRTLWINATSNRIALLMAVLLCNACVTAGKGATTHASSVVFNSPDIVGAREIRVRSGHRMSAQVDYTIGQYENVYSEAPVVLRESDIIDPEYGLFGELPPGLE